MKVRRSDDPVVLCAKGQCCARNTFMPPDHPGSHPRGGIMDAIVGHVPLVCDPQRYLHVVAGTQAEL